jgi:hypothetical protein
MTPLDEEVDAPSDPVVPSDDDETETVTLEDADANDDGEYSEEELTALTKAQLLTLCETLNVEGVTSSNTKAQLIAAILAAQEADDQENLGGS